jgi:glutathionylspermidine synthase
MKRKEFPKRDNFEQINEELGFDFQVVEEKQYWIEDVGYEFTSKEIDKIEDATNKLHQMCFVAIDHIVKHKLYDLLEIPPKMIPYIEKSWSREDWSLFGRFDFCLENNKIKMYEYNADTPTSLLEASVIQYNWMKGQGLNDQFNSIEEKMIAWWQSFAEEKLDGETVYFTTVKDNVEDYRNVEYIMDTAHQAGLKTDFIFIEDIGSDEDKTNLYDMSGKEIKVLFKLYPWEWLANEDFCDILLTDNCLIIEPVWKMLLSNKAILAILWELFPGNEYLLPTYFSPEKLGTSYVKKPLLSREGQNVEIIKDGQNESKDGVYKSERNIYQAVCVLPLIDNYYPVIGSWVVGEESAGMGIREDESKITANLSRFVSHYIADEDDNLLNLLKEGI